jgi:hypothetical protein
MPVSSPSSRQPDPDIRASNLAHGILLVNSRTFTHDPNQGNSNVLQNAFRRAADRFSVVRSDARHGCGLLADSAAFGRAVCEASGASLPDRQPASSEMRTTPDAHHDDRERPLRNASGLRVAEWSVAQL